MEEQNMGKIIVDGKFVDLDNTPLDELRKIQEQISQKEAAKRKEIEELLAEDEFNEEDLNEKFETEEER